jgi:hypothetical protein
MRLGVYSPKAFEAALQQIRVLTCEKDPNVSIPKAQTLCAAAGVAVVLEPAPKGCPVSGAAKWLGPGRGLIMLSLRGKSDDHLIQPADYKKLLALKPWSVPVIKEFAKSIQVSPGIVLGRLQFDRHLPWGRFDTLKVRYRWPHEA